MLIYSFIYTCIDVRFYSRGRLLQKNKDMGINKNSDNYRETSDGGSGDGDCIDSINLEKFSPSSSPIRVQPSSKTAHTHGGSIIHRDITQRKYGNDENDDVDDNNIAINREERIAMMHSRRSKSRKDTLSSSSSTSSFSSLPYFR